jgi:hypothetical protein
MAVHCQLHCAAVAVLYGSAVAVLHTVSTPDGVRCGPAVVRPLRLRVLLPPGACVSVCCDRCILSLRRRKLLRFFLQCVPI